MTTLSDRLKATRRDEIDQTPPVRQRDWERGHAPGRPQHDTGGRDLSGADGPVGVAATRRPAATRWRS